MTLPTEQSEKPRSWIYRHLHGYMIIVYTIDLALGALWFANGKYPAPVPHFDLLLMDAMIVVSIIPPISMFAKWVNKQCVGVYWPVKYSSMIGFVGTFLLIGAMMGENYITTTTPEPYYPSDIYISESDKYQVSDQASPSAILDAIKRSSYWGMLSVYQYEIESDPKGWLEGHPYMWSEPGFRVFLEPKDYSDKLAKAEADRQRQFEEYSVQVKIREELLRPFNLVGAFAFVFFVGGLVGSLGMVVTIGKKEGAW